MINTSLGLQNDSQLICSKNARFCKATNLYINFQQFHNFVSNDARDRFLENIFKKGDIGGKCKLDTSKLAEQGEHKSALQSWYARPSEKNGCMFIKMLIFYSLVY